MLLWISKKHISIIPSYINAVVDVYLICMRDVAGKVIGYYANSNSKFQHTDTNTRDAVP